MFLTKGVIDSRYLLSLTLCKLNYLIGAGGDCCVLSQYNAQTKKVILDRFFKLNLISIIKLHDVDFFFQ